MTFICKIFSNEQQKLIKNTSHLKENLNTFLWQRVKSFSFLFCISLEHGNEYFITASTTRVSQTTKEKFKRTFTVLLFTIFYVSTLFVISLPFVSFDNIYKRILFNCVNFLYLSKTHSKPACFNAK